MVVNAAKNSVFGVRRNKRTGTVVRRPTTTTSKLRISVNKLKEANWTQYSSLTRTWTQHQELMSLIQNHKSETNIVQHSKQVENVKVGGFCLFSICLVSQVSMCIGMNGLK